MTERAEINANEDPSYPRPTGRMGENPWVRLVIDNFLYGKDSAGKEELRELCKTTKGSLWEDMVGFVVPKRERHD